MQARLEAHRQQQAQHEAQVSSKTALCQQAREQLQRKIGARKDPFQVLLALRVPVSQEAGVPFATRVRLAACSIDCNVPGDACQNSMQAASC